MELEPYEPIGVEVTKMSLRRLRWDQIPVLKGALAKHGVAVFPGQHLDDDALVALLQQLGTLIFTTGETPVAGYPDLNVISNVGRTVPPSSNFHVDSSYLSRPPIYTALRAVHIPSRGGQTLFTNQYLAYERLPVDMVSRLQGRLVTHVVTGLDLGEEDETSAEHPLFSSHPISNRTALYLSTPARCVAVSGMGPQESAEVVQYLYEHSTREDNVFRHSWAPGDVVIWDNRCVMHKADHTGVVGDRVMHRGMVTNA
ncbi:MAG: TauD/TfdA family dioxygenase [Nocardioides sp.]